MRLEAELGDRGGLALIRLWGWARRHREDGHLGDLTDREIASAARWKGSAASFVKGLVGSGFIDVSPNGTRRLHAWVEHQSHSANSKGFRRAQRLKSVQRWAKKAGMTPEAYARFSFGVDLEAYLCADWDAGGNAPAYAPALPNDAHADAESMPPPLHTTPQHITAPGHVPMPDPERGFATTPSSPPPNQQEPPGLGRPPRLDPGLSDQPVDAAGDTPQAQAAELGSLAHSLELKIMTSYVQANKHVRTLAGYGMTTAEIRAAIDATPPGKQPPWTWAEHAHRQHLNATTGHIA
jgi:hypothetical protein